MNGIIFREEIYARLDQIVEEKLIERKKHIAAIYFSERIDDQEEDLQVLKQGDEPIKKALAAQRAGIEATARRVAGMKGANSKLIASTDEIRSKIRKDNPTPSGRQGVRSQFGNRLAKMPASALGVKKKSK